LQQPWQGHGVRRQAEREVRQEFLSWQPAAAEKLPEFLPWQHAAAEKTPNSLPS
jgi:hypothetical protein